MDISSVSLFSGCGGFDLGVTRLGVKILWANDNSLNAASTYQKYFPEVEFVHNDIRKIDKQRMPQAELLIGCYPCQGFSNGAWRRWGERGKRDLFENQDNYLFLEFVNAVPYVNPKFIFIENVPGLAASAKGWFFEAQKQALDIAGYEVYTSILNAQEYGIAQSRKRLFIVAVRKDIKFKYEFPKITHGPKGQFPYRTQADVIGHLPEWPKNEYDTTKFHGHYLTRNRKRPWNDCSYTIVAESDHVTLHPMGEPMKMVSRDDWRLQGSTNRRLSWRECALIQSFDEDFEPSGSLPLKYRQIGNAVPPHMAQLIAQPVIDFLRTK